MPVQYEQAITFHGKPARVITTISLVPLAEAAHDISGLPPGKVDRTLGDALATGTGGFTTRNPYTNESVYVSYEEVARAYVDVDFYNVSLRVEFRLELDHSQGPTIYANDIVDDLRRWGHTEEQIEEQLEREKRNRGQRGG
ncbi:MAG: hypothetical protein HZC41_04745 [Chloroflexi bacterium]|nr:hypothetical protein [Chloroflexota bacterium]